MRGVGTVSNAGAEQGSDAQKGGMGGNPLRAGNGRVPRGKDIPAVS